MNQFSLLIVIAALFIAYKIKTKAPDMKTANVKISAAQAEVLKKYGYAADDPRFQPGVEPIPQLVGANINSSLEKNAEGIFLTGSVGNPHRAPFNGVKVRYRVFDVLKKVDITSGEIDIGTLAPGESRDLTRKIFSYSSNTTMAPGFNYEVQLVDGFSVGELVK